MEVKKEKIREPIYDFIRVISCLCIIGIHCTDTLMYTQGHNYIWWTGNIIQSIVRIGLPMFVLLSGALILNGKEEALGKFYIKRFIKIVIHLYLYSLIYIYLFDYKLSLEILEPANFFNSIKQIANGSVYFHLWFVYMIIGIYLCAPFLRRMCQNLTDKECKGLFVLILAISVIKYLLPSFGINIIITNIPFVEWTLIFLLGYLVTRESINKHYKIIYILGLISFILSIVVRTGIISIKNINDLSITMLFEIMAIFIFFIRNKNKICTNIKLNKIVTFLSKYTWEIYLIHGAFFDIVINHIMPDNMNRILYSIVLTVLVTILSFIAAFIIHNLITKNIEKLLYKIDITKIKIFIKDKLNIAKHKLLCDKK